MIKITKDRIKDEYWPYRISDSSVPGSCICMNKKEIQQLHKKISKILGVVDWKAELERDKAKFI